jgi:hypothetical protein
MRSCVLFNLPEVLFRHVLVDWLRFGHVVLLDSACCSHMLRSQFLSFAYGQFTTFTLPRRIFSTKFLPALGWCVSRRAQLTGICINELYPINVQLLSKFLSMAGPALRWVHFCAVTVDGCHLEVLETIQWRPNIQKLKLRGAGHWNDRLPRLTKAFQNLINLSLEHLSISPQSLATALQHCSSLEELCVAAVSGVMPVEAAIPTLRRIRTTSLAMTDAALTAIGRRCPRLETLDVFATSEIEGYCVTDVGMRALLVGCPLLRETDVQKVTGISTELRVELARRCNLLMLSFFGWREMSDALARGVLQVSPNLNLLDFHHHGGHKPPQCGTGRSARDFLSTSPY